TDDAPPAQRTSAATERAAAVATGAVVPAGVPTFPTIPRAALLAPPRATPDGDSRLARWCIAEPDAATAATTVVEALLGGWDHVTRRGSGAKIGVSASRADHRISIVVGGVDAACTGITATATIVKAGVFTPPPPLEPGDKIR
ncbi:MAG: hypothetical protein H0X17_15940, partial [Deltaproteobacteria bacterium]|nr:hypothetical protein [Deltaproteobacteria bacterium]